MNLLPQNKEISPRISGDILAALVDTLFAPVISMMIGSFCAILISVVVAERTGNPVFLYCAAMLGCLFVARAALVWLYRRSNPTLAADPAALSNWQLAYACAAYAFSAVIGALGYAALTLSDDAVSHMLVVTLGIGYLAGAATRNSAIKQIAVWQATLSIVPIGVAAVMRDEFAYDILALVLFLYALGGVEISLYQSGAAMRVLLTRKEKSELAQQLEEQNRRFDAALNNMPQALCMFDGDGRLSVANARLAEILGLDLNGLVDQKITIEDFAARAAACKALGPEAAKIATMELRRNLHEGRATSIRIALADGRIIAADQAPIEGGGAVVMYDDVTERDQAEARVRYLATHDVLTGLPNRTLFTQLLREEIEAARESQRAFCVLFIDLDRFKVINDTLGHRAGDAMLREVSKRLGQCLQPGDMSARLGGDEFVIILRGAATAPEATVVADAILERLNEPMHIGGQECGVSASIGLAVYPTDGEDEEALLRNADSAMYLAKAEGKSGVRQFSSRVKTQTLQGLMLETSMRHALARNELLVVYQPKRNIATGAMCGVEALLRWRHPELGVLTPDRFVPLAEETGLIAPIGKWVLETACRQQMQWRAQGLPPLPVAVNLSPRQLYDDHIIRDISEALANSGMEPEWLELEITESMVMQDAGDAIMALRAIKETGAQLAIDDFGTGYSSLSLVKRLPLDAIKIDRSFINDLLTDPSDRAIADAVISLGLALKLRVIAEGVETEAQEAYLRERGCSEMQGFLFSRPLEPDALANFAADYSLSRLRHHIGPRAEVRKSA